MSLKDLVDQRTEIAHNDLSFTVRGLSLEDMVVLLENHADALSRVFAGERGTDFSELIKEFPAFVAACIAYAAEEPEMVDSVRRLPIGVQLRAIEAVWELSSLDVETVGKLAVSMLNSVSKLNDEHLNQLKSNLTMSSQDLPAQQSS